MGPSWCIIAEGTAYNNSHVSKLASRPIRADAQTNYLGDVSE